VFYINKKGFLLAFKNTFFNIFIKEIYKKACKVFRLVPLNTIKVINYFKV
ncbi:hypothetical protein BU23DRAFT_482234, partial [Bimuria novae-zelandiae CBS 107.79]